MLADLYAQQVAARKQKEAPLARLLAPVKDYISTPSQLDRLREMLNIQTPLPVGAVSLAEDPWREMARLAWSVSSKPAIGFTPEADLIGVDPQLLEFRKAIARTAGSPAPEQKKFLMKLAEKLASRYGWTADKLYEAEMNRYKAGISAGISHPELTSAERYEEYMKDWANQIRKSSKKNEKR